MLLECMETSPLSGADRPGHDPVWKINEPCSAKTGLNAYAYEKGTYFKLKIQ